MISPVARNMQQSYVYLKELLAILGQFPQDISYLLLQRPHLFFIAVQRFERGENGRAAFTEVHPQVSIQALPKLLTCTEEK